VPCMVNLRLLRVVVLVRARFGPSRSDSRLQR
jgi:hypothetical protein